VGTPKWIVNPLYKAIDGFDLDPASGAEPEPYAENKYTEEDDGLSQDWFGHVWLNPPYGREHNNDWAKKAFQESNKTKSITALVPASTSTQWWQKYYAKADVFCFIEGRVEFLGAGDTAASFASVLCVFGQENLPGQYWIELDKMGTVMSSEVNQRSIFDY